MPLVSHDEQTKKRFWSKVSKGPKNQCWEWQSTMHVRGYGVFRGLNHKQVRASRVAYELTFGILNPDINVLHRCDNPACCNPNHLFLGTQADNVRDMIKKGRRADLSGEKHGMAKLTKANAAKIKLLLKNGGSISKISRQYGVAISTIACIKYGLTWRNA